MSGKYYYRTFRCSDRLCQDIEETAEMMGMNASELIREAISAHVRSLREHDFYLPKGKRKEVVEHQPAR